MPARRPLRRWRRRAEQLTQEQRLALLVRLATERLTECQGAIVGEQQTRPTNHSRRPLDRSGLRRPGSRRARSALSHGPACVRPQRAQAAGASPAAPGRPQGGSRRLPAGRDRAARAVLGPGRLRQDRDDPSVARGRRADQRVAPARRRRQRPRHAPAVPRPGAPRSHPARHEGPDVARPARSADPGGHPPCDGQGGVVRAPLHPGAGRRPPRP